jgi:hypothetical protein
MANPTFSEAFDTISGKVSTYMVEEYNQGRLTDVNYATVQAQAIQAIINGAVQLHLTTDKSSEETLLVAEQKNLVSKQALDIVKQTSVKDYQLATLLPDEHTKNVKQQDLMDAQKAHQQEETKYTNARKRIALASRIDNLIIEDLKAQMQQLSTVGAGGLTPTKEDFVAGNDLRDAVYKRAINGVTLNNSIAFGESTETAPSAINFTVALEPKYQKAL